MPETIHVMQMIDSLSIGGAERVSVNYANALSQQENCRSYHCTTREEGMLKEFLYRDVGTFFMEKKSLLDINAYRNLIQYVKNNKITIIHAHSTSFFTAFIVKLFTGVKIVWHDHYGNAEKLDKRSLPGLKFTSMFFSYVISVNKILQDWAKDKLLIDKGKIEYVPNYADAEFTQKVPDLPGVKGKRIVSLANLRPQKDHLNLLKAYKTLFNGGLKDWSLLLVGRDWEDSYSDSIKQYIDDNSLENNVFVLGGRSDTFSILQHCDIGVLSSESEGLPIALLEYGLASLAVVCTDVGECATVLDHGKVGELVKPKDSEELYKALLKLVNMGERRKELGSIFHQYVNSNYSKEAIIQHVLEVYRSL